MRSKALVLAAALFLGACETFTAVVPVAIEKGRATADTAAKGNLGLVCATTVGAYYRLENPNHQEGIRLICKPGGTALPE